MKQIEVEKILKGSLQWKFKLWVGTFAWGVKAKHCWELSGNFCKQKVCWHHPALFTLLPQVNVPTNNLNFHWRWRWIQAIFLNLFYFICANETCEFHFNPSFTSWKSSNFMIFHQSELIRCTKFNCDIKLNLTTLPYLWLDWMFMFQNKYQK